MATLPQSRSEADGRIATAAALGRLRSVGMLAAPLVLLTATAHLLPPYYARVVDSVLIYSLLALGLNIVVGYAGLLDLGFVAFYAIGAYSYALLASAHFDLHLPFLLVLAIGMTLAGLAGFLLGLPVLRLRGDYLAIVTLGFGEVIRILLNNLDAVTNGPQGITRIDVPTILGWRLHTPAEFLYLLAGLVAVVFFVAHRLEMSPLGKAWRAIREDQDAAAGLGISTSAVKLLAFGISATIGGMAGVLFAAQQRFVDPESFQFWESLVVLLIIVVGGLGNILGVLLGATLLVTLPELLREWSDIRMLIYGLALVIVILLRPNGLLPQGYGVSWLLEKLGWR